jgi:hypothetical protein
LGERLIWYFVQSIYTVRVSWSTRRTVPAGSNAFRPLTNVPVSTIT